MVVGGTLDRCDYCGAAGAQAQCSGCGAVRYCGPECQRSAWRAGHRLECKGRQPKSQPGGAGPSAAVAAALAAVSAPVEEPAPAAQQPPQQEAVQWPVRCPSELIGRRLPRLDRIDGGSAQEMFCEGQAFVAPAEGLLGTKLLRWDWKYLERHLPEGQKYGVMLDEGSGKIVMSHTARNGQRQVGREDLEAQQASAGDEPLNTSDQTRMTFKEFLEDAARYKDSGGKTKLPYFGLHVLWRFKENENGYLGKIGEEMANDLWTSVRFDTIKEWQDANLLPLVQRFYLFAGLGGTLYHCHFDLQPNLHVQLTGRKRFILFPPEAWPHLYPFPVHHDLDRRSMVDLDSPDGSRFPSWRGARGFEVELGPGDALYIPPYWWHHVQSLTPETTSMAMWFFEHFPQSRRELYGIGPRSSGIRLLRDLEEFLGALFPNAPGEEDCSKSRPVKAGEVHNFMQWLKARLGAPAAEVDRALLGRMTCTPDEALAQLRQLVVEYGTGDTEAEVFAKLRRILAGRF